MDKSGRREMTRRETERGAEKESVKGRKKRKRELRRPGWRERGA